MFWPWVFDVFGVNLQVGSCRVVVLIKTSSKLQGIYKMEQQHTEMRSPCPISRSLELFGDKWSLLILRDILFFGKTTYNEFLDSGERIATNILRDRLNKLTEAGIIGYTGSDKRKKYALTDKGMDLKPVLTAIAGFGMKHFPGSKEYAQAYSRKQTSK